MRIWLDLSNSPHVPLFEPVVDLLRAEGHEVLLTARDHAQTVELARQRWPDVVIVGGKSPAARIAKGRALAARGRALFRFARDAAPDVALSHGSYAQLLAARLAGIPSVTMMDYEHQPANHLSFRLAGRVLVPAAFPSAALRRCGARSRKTRRYEGFKEELYLAGFESDPGVISELGLDASKILAVLRPPPIGALYHQNGNVRFSHMLEVLRAEPQSQVVVLPRAKEDASAFRALENVTVPTHAVDGRSLLALADLTVGAGGTMTRESALLGTPTYTVFAGKLAAVDRELMRLGLLKDLRDVGSKPEIRKKGRSQPYASNERRERLLDLILESVDAVGS